jgi:hypothetical protein
MASIPDLREWPLRLASVICNSSFVSAKFINLLPKLKNVATKSKNMV